VKYKVLIKKCEDVARASRIAQEIARWSGSQVETVLNSLVVKPICVRQEAEEQEAMKIKTQFEAVGAEVVLAAIGVGAAAGPASSIKPAAAAVSSSDDEEEAPGRLLSEQEYLEVLKSRKDIFII
jgi:malate/lactate dehydrogenase